MARIPDPHPVLTTERLRLRQFSMEDVEAMHECFSSPAVMRFWNHPPHSRRTETERSVKRFIDCTPAYYRFWAVADAKSDECFGMVNYHDGHIRNRRVMVGYLVRPTLQRQGIAFEATSAMIGYCFDRLCMHRVQALIHPDNRPSISLIEKLGFQREGLLRENLRVADEWRDDVLYARLAHNS